jgi:hypothetical protein
MGLGVAGSTALLTLLALNYFDVGGAVGAAFSEAGRNLMATSPA